MKNIILQHFTGELRELDKLSVDNIRGYAKRVQADYKLILGQVFRKHLTSPCQKVFLLDESFDEYDNVFEEDGIGLYEDVQKRLHTRLASEYPMIASKDSHYWGGAIYKMDLPTRQRLRKELGGNEGWMNNYNMPYHYEDEGIFHTLVFRSGFKSKTPYLNRRWCQCSFLPEPEKAGFIHIRTKVTPTGPKREKMRNYEELVQGNIL